MTSRLSRGSGTARSARRARRALPALPRRVREQPPPERATLALLVLLSVGATLGTVRHSLNWFPASFLVVPLLLGGLMLRSRAMGRLTAVVAACLVVDLVRTGVSGVRVGALVALAVTALVAHEHARSRDETGLGGLSGDAVLVELRARLGQQGELPALPAPWRAEAVVKPAGGGPFAGDFVVSALDGDRFEVALVDVSGKGVEAGSRSLLLSGAMGGLLGGTEPQEFLTAASSYLVRQDWEEGFATSVHVCLDLATGEFAVGSAGHPPAAHFDAGSGRWSLLTAQGPALGVVRDPQFVVARGHLRHGDALLLYTDGLVEVPGRDLERGIDKLLGEAEHLVTRGFAGGGQVLLKKVAERISDDRGIVLLWRGTL